MVTCPACTGKCNQNMSLRLAFATVLLMICVSSILTIGLGWQWPSQCVISVRYTLTWGTSLRLTMHAHFSMWRVKSQEVQIQIEDRQNVFKCKTTCSYASNQSRKSAVKYVTIKEAPARIILSTASNAIALRSNTPAAAPACIIMYSPPTW